MRKLWLRDISFALVGLFALYGLFTLPSDAYEFAGPAVQDTVANIQGWYTSFGTEEDLRKAELNCMKAYENGEINIACQKFYEEHASRDVKTCITEQHPETLLQKPY